MIPNDFHFERPFWLLALIPVAIVLWYAVRTSVRGSAWRNAVDAHLLKHLSLPGEGGTARWPFWLLGAGWLAAAVAMAGPSWERVPQPTTKTIEPTVVAVDMSVSMDAEDLTPSRLARARYKLQDVLERSAGGQVGLVIYSDEPFVASPLTDDARVIGEMIPSLTSDIMPGRGSRPDRAIDQAAALLEQAGVPGGRILLLADSAGDDPSATRAAATRAAEDGRRVSVLAVGTEEGAPVRDGRGGFARTADGEVFMARLPVDELQALAVAGSGRFAQVTANDSDLQVVLAQPAAIAETQESRLVGADVEIWKDAGIHLLWIPLLVAPFAFRRGWLAIVLLTVVIGSPTDARAGVWDDLWQTRDQQAAAAFASGDVERASELFASADWRAAAQYESGEYEAARAEFAELPGSENRYNLGNTLARSGQLEEAIAAYDEVLEMEPEHEDAKFNRDLVEKLLQQQRERQEQEQQSESGEGSEDEQQQSDGQSGQEEQQDQADSGSDSDEQQSADASQGEGSEEEQSTDQATAGADEQSSEEEQGAQQSASAANGQEPDAEQEPGDRGESQERSQEDYASQSPPDAGDAPNSMAEPMDQALESERSEDEAEAESRRAAAESPEPMSEEQQAREQLLRQVPDDPAGLLRAKIHRKYAEKRFAEQQRQLVQQGGTNPWW